MSDEKIIEAVARMFLPHLDPYDENSDEGNEGDARKLAAETLTAIRAAGFAIVPTEGEGLEAMVERSIAGWYGAASWQEISGRQENERLLPLIRGDATRSLRAALGVSHD